MTIIAAASAVCFLVMVRAPPVRDRDTNATVTDGTCRPRLWLKKFDISIQGIRTARPPPQAGLPRTGCDRVKLPGVRPNADEWLYLLHTQQAGGVALWGDGLGAVQTALPKIQAGAWITPDFDSRQEVTTKRTESQTLGPPQKQKRPARKGAKHAVDRGTKNRGNSRVATS